MIFIVPACTSFTLENGSTRCSQANMRKSVCTHTCNEGFILLRASKFNYQNFGNSNNVCFRSLTNQPKLGCALNRIRIG